MVRTKQILVVDDDVDFADSVADLLRSEGHSVTAVYGGDAAVRLAQDRCFDLVLVDMQMPGRDGIHSLRSILERRPGARVVMMTGYSVPLRLRQAVAAGAAGVMKKPLDLARLHALIDGVASPLVVLVVEDDADFSDSLCSILEDAGHSVMVAGNGAEAVERALARRPDLMMLDLRLPGMGGIEVVRQLAARGVDLPTIVLSAYVEEERESLEADLGDLPAEQILRKPAQTRCLLQLVERVAGGR